MALVAGFVAFAVLDPPLGVIALVCGAVIEVGEAVLWNRYLRRFKVRSGPETLLGRRAAVIEECRPRGRVKLGGEIWRAECGAGAGVGQTVEVVALERLTLAVAPVEGDVWQPRRERGGAG